MLGGRTHGDTHRVTCTEETHTENMHRKTNVQGGYIHKGQILMEGIHKDKYARG
jgi:hypothetical protein